MQGRLYPPSIAPFDDEPTADRFRIADLGALGEGLMSLTEFDVGDLLLRFRGRVRHDQTLFTLQEAPGVYVEDPWVSGKLIHHCDPNCWVDVAARTITAIRPIRAGDLITMDYDTTEDELFRSFHCRCGAVNCRGFIAGRRALLDPVALSSGALSASM